MKNHEVANFQSRPWFPDLRLRILPGSPSLAWKPNGQSGVSTHEFIHVFCRCCSCSHSCFQKSNFPATFCSLNHYLRHPGLDTKWRASPLNGLLLRPRWTATFMWYHVIVLLYMIMWWFLSWCFALSPRGQVATLEEGGNEAARAKWYGTELGYFWIFLIFLAQLQMWWGGQSD